MLPFLKKNQRTQAGVIVHNRAPDEKPEENQNDSHDEAILSCAKDLITAVHARNTQGVADAMRSAFEALEKLPHEEVDHDEDNSFAGRNIAAAKED